MIVALNMANEPHTLKFSARELGGEGKGLRWAMSKLGRDLRQTSDAGHLTLAPYEAAAFEVTGK